MPPKKRVDSDDEDAEKQKLKESIKAAVFYTVATISQEEEVALGGIIVSPALVASLVELVYAQALHLAGELETFAAHANRSTITIDDMYLLCRNNPSLKDLLSEEAVRYGAEAAPTSLVKKAKPSKAKPATSKRAGTK